MTRKSRPLRDARCSRGTRWLSLVLALSLVVASVPNGLAYSVDQSGPASGVEAAEPTPADLQQLVAPIALYPDELSRRFSPRRPIPSRSWRPIGGSSSTRRSRDRSWQRRSTRSRGTRA